MVRHLDPALRRSRFERDFVAISAAFCVLMVLTNVIGTKLFLLFPEWLPQGFGALTDHHYVVLTTGLVTYPLTFLFTDIASEVWGRRRANYMVALGFGCSLLMLVTLEIAGWVPRADRYWADAANQPIEGTVTVTAVEAGATALPIDDGAELLLADGERGLALALVSGGEAVALRYEGLDRPMHVTPGSDDPSPVRWDHRGELRLSQPLAAPIPAGTWIVPAVEVIGSGEAAITVDRPWLLPPSGRLVARDGALLGYPSRDGATGALSTSGAWNSPLPVAGQPAVGAVLGVHNTRSPSQLAQAFTAVFSAPGSLLFASMTAYLFAQFLDVWLYHFWRRVTKGRFLWLRNNGSTMISQMVDTIVVHVIFLPLAFGMPWPAVFQIILGVYVVKMVLAWIDTPFIYLGVWIAKHRLGYAWNEDVDEDLIGTAAGYPEGLFKGLRSIGRRRHLSASTDDDD